MGHDGQYRRPVPGEAQLPDNILPVRGGIAVRLDWLMSKVHTPGSPRRALPIEVFIGMHNLSYSES